MLPETGQTLDTVPLIPESILKQHFCYEPFDTRFRAAGRLMQSLWRSQRKLPMGGFALADGKKRKLGSMVTPSAGLSGANFLTPEIAYAVHREVAYREIGAMVEEKRLFCNLLSSMPLCFNVFVPLKHDLVRATSFLHEAVPGFAGTVTQVLFEHSPGRGNPKYTADFTAFDVLFRYTTPGHRRGFVAMEVKYSESMREPLAKPRARYDELSQSCGLFIDHAAPALRNHPIEQLWRELMLAESSIGAGLYDEGTFVLIAPEHNHLAQQAGQIFADHLLPSAEGKARFHTLTLEQAIETIRLCDPDHARALHRRYTDWMLVDGELELTFSQIGKTLPKTPRKRSKMTAKRPAEQDDPREVQTSLAESASGAPPF